MNINEGLLFIYNSFISLYKDFDIFDSCQFWLIVLVCKNKARLSEKKTKTICAGNYRMTTVLPDTLRRNFKLVSIEARQQKIANQKKKYCEPWVVRLKVIFEE